MAIELLSADLAPLISHSLNHHRNALPYAYTHGAQCILASSAMQLVDGRQDQTRARSTERMPQGDGATVRVHARITVLKAQLAQNS